MSPSDEPAHSSHHCDAQGAQAVKGLCPELAWPPQVGSYLTVPYVHHQHHVTSDMWERSEFDVRTVTSVHAESTDSELLGTYTAGTETATTPYYTRPGQAV